MEVGLVVLSGIPIPQYIMVLALIVILAIQCNLPRITRLSWGHHSIMPESPAVLRGNARLAMMAQMLLENLPRISL